MHSERWVAARHLTKEEEGGGGGRGGDCVITKRQLLSFPWSQGSNGVNKPTTKN